eukprot:8006754-Heterocapsa_arctica.AAC.1
MPVFADVVDEADQAQAEARWLVVELGEGTTQAYIPLLWSRACSADKPEEAVEHVFELSSIQGHALYLARHRPKGTALPNGPERSLSRIVSSSH